MPIIRIEPQDRAQWLAARAQDVTASAVGALFGVHEFVTPFALWAAKAGRVPYDDEETPPMRRGRLLEPVAVALLREIEPGWTLHYNSAQSYWRDPDARLGGTPDVLATDQRRGPGVVQIKSVEAGVYRRKWFAPDGTPEPPLWVALQATLEARLTGAEWAAVAPLVVGHGLEMPLIDIPLVPGIYESMAAKSREFWALVASGVTPPADYALDSGVLDALYAKADEWHEIDLSRDNAARTLVANRRALLEDRRRINDDIEAIDAEIKAKMGNANKAHLGAGRAIKWAQQYRRAFTVPAATMRVLRYPREDEE